MEWKWCLGGENRKEESKDEEEGFENNSGESQKKGTLLFVFY